MAVKCPNCHSENPDDSIYCGKCSTSLKPSEGISPTKTLETPAKGLTTGTTFASRYEVIEELGKGGMGRVYKALDKEINEEVAIKLLKPEIASDESTVERFRNELKFARKIAHKNVCKMYHLATEEETPYIIMEYVPGEDLKSLVKKKGKLTDEEAISIARQVCEGLVEAHRLGVVHRDLKPQNIMIDEQDDAKIMDFGIARELNVDALVEGTVQQAGGSVSIRVRLIDALPEELNIWTQTYERAITREIKVKLTPQEETRLASASQIDPETYAAYLKGMFYLNKQTQEGIEKGLAYFHQAVEKNPADPLAYAGLALGYATIGHSAASTPDAWPRAREAALRALKLDETLAEAHAALADVKLYYEWDWEGAEQAFQRANELNPNLAMNHYHYAWYHALFGRLDEAIEEHEQAQELDPLTPLHTAYLGELYLWNGQYDEAINEARKSLDLDPDFPIGWSVLGSVYRAKGMYEEAIAAHQKMVEISPGRKGKLGHTYALAGRMDEAQKILAEMEEEEPTSYGALGLARLYTALGEKDKAFRWLAHEPPHAFFPWVRVGPPWEPLRDDPRFKDLLRRLNLPDLE